MTQLHNITRPSSLKRAYRRVGRGQSSTRGKQSGRGGKGQTARAGHKIRPALRDIIKKLPKRRGYGKNRGRTVDGTRLDAVTISVERLGVLFDNGAEVSMKSLMEKGATHFRKVTPVKIVGGGELSKKLSLTGLSVSASARAAIEKAGGTVGEYVSAASAQAVRTKAKKAAAKKS